EWRLFGLRLPRDEIEAQREPLVSADEVDLFDDAVGQAAHTFGQRARLTQDHIFGPKDELDGLTVAEAFGLCAGRNRGRADLDRAVIDDAHEQIRRAEKR